MKNENFKGSVVQGVCTILSGILAVVLGGSGFAYLINTLNMNSKVYNNGGNIVNGDVHIDNSTDVSYNINTQNQSVNEATTLAHTACIEGDYDRAYDLYRDNEETTALINLGYILAQGLSYVGEDVQRAEECYQKADCIEADRNLLILYLENGMVEEAKEMCRILLWILDDDITWDYIINCLYQKTWNDYQEETGITKEEFSFDLNSLYEWEYIDSYYNGSNPPSNTKRKQWIIQGIDFAFGEGENHPYGIYRAQRCVFANNIENMEGMYCEHDGKLYSLDD